MGHQVIMYLELPVMSSFLSGTAKLHHKMEMANPEVSTRRLERLSGYISREHRPLPYQTLLCQGPIVI